MPPACPTPSAPRRAPPPPPGIAGDAGLTTATSSFQAGGILRDYQLVGIRWLASLYENGLNGILADEMGLGKTLQTIGLLCHLRDNGAKAPHLIVAPLSTVGNWVREFHKWAPTFPVILYHGDKNERAALRAEHMRDPTSDTFPVVVTSYEIMMNDRTALARYQWKYIVVDEGHRLKNKDCRLIRELKRLDSGNRLLLTGTPLQNDLSELWSLLNFLLPDLFDDLEAFNTWFDLSGVEDDGDGHAAIIAREQEKHVISKLHQILQTFLLRRLKSQVLTQLPPKHEVIIHTPLSEVQQPYYRAILEGRLHAMLEENARGEKHNTQVGDLKSMKLNNAFMQLRKCCNHPYLFDEPLDKDGNVVTDERIVSSAGKMAVLDRMLSELKRRGHRVIIFTQMTRILDILEDYLLMRGHRYVRLDGTVKVQDRNDRIAEFERDEDMLCFIASTRAGGLGINLTSADTVILYDSDWNPQMDLQAQDRAHRLGQKKAVVIYRLVTGGTAESKVLKRAQDKLRLERMVIHKKKFTTKGHKGAAEAQKSNQALKEGKRTIQIAELQAILKEEIGQLAKPYDERSSAIDNDALMELLDRESIAARGAKQAATFQIIEEQPDANLIDNLVQ